MTPEDFVWVMAVTVVTTLIAISIFEILKALI